MVEEDGWSRLHIACMNDDVEEIDRLLWYPETNIEAETNHGNRPIHFASRCGKVHALRRLLSHSQTPSLIPKNNDGLTPMDLARENGHEEIIAALKSEMGVQLSMACEKGDLEQVMQWIDLGVDVNHVFIGGFPALHFASWKGHPECAQALLDAGAEINFTRNGEIGTALDLAREYNHDDVASLLLKHAEKLGQKGEDEKNKDPQNSLTKKDLEDLKRELCKDLIGEMQKLMTASMENLEALIEAKVEEHLTKKLTSQ